MKKKLLAVVLSAVLAMSFSAFASAESTEVESKGVCKVGIVVKSLDNDYYTTLKNGAVDRAEELGADVVDLTFVAPNAEIDVQTWVNQVSDLIAAEVDVIGVCPADDEACLPIIKEAGDAGIQIIAVDNDTSYEGKKSFIGTDNYDAALLGGEYCAGVVGEGANAIILRGPTGSSNHDERQKGIEDALAEGGVNVLEVKDANCVAETAMTAIEDLMTVYDDIDLIICTNDLMCIGAQRAVQAAGKDIPCFGFDGSVDVCKGTQEGLYLGSVAQAPYEMGKIAIDSAIALFNGEEIEERIDSGCEVVTAENAADFIPEE